MARRISRSCKAARIVLSRMMRRCNNSSTTPLTGSVTSEEKNSTDSYSSIFEVFDVSNAARYWRCHPCSALLSISAHAVWFYFVYGDVPKLFGFLGGPFMVTVHVSQLDNCRNRLSTLFCRNIRQFSQIPAGKEGFHAGLLIFF